MASLSLRFKQYWYFAATIFVSAFLLFQVQPVISKYILPWFGGGSSVWTTSQLFFEALLVGGYGYAFWLNRKNLKTQGRVHYGVILAALAFIALTALAWGAPLMPGPAFKPQPGAFPVWQALLVLLVGVGLPYFLLSTTSSLMQSWFARLYTTDSPYSFYVLSNAASLFALLSYPFLFEPRLSLHQQAWFWGAGFVLFLALLGFSLRQVLLCAPERENFAPQAASEDDPTPIADAEEEKPLWLQSLGWVNLSMCGTVLLLATTNQLTQDVASVPLLWVLPLSLYLLSFIAAFTRFVERHRGWVVFLMMIALFVALVLLADPTPMPVWLQVTANGFVMFAGCLLCHSELYRSRPAPEHLTDFYLALAIGGAAGGVLVGLVAPVLFHDFWEYPAALAICADLVVSAAFKEQHGGLFKLRITVTGVTLVTAGLIILVRYVSYTSALETTRDFYGVQRVRLDQYGGIPAYSLVSGSTVHGIEAVDHAQQTTVPGYYTETSGAGLAFTQDPHRLAGQPLKVGVIGLGTGTMAAFGQSGDTLRFYELDPQVIRLARNTRYFTYLKDTKATVQIVEGDGRLSLERELAAGQPGNFDILFIDAFSSDSVPVHLISVEAIRLYLAHMKPDGLLVFNISNQYLDLEPVLAQAKQALGLKGVFIQGRPSNALGFPSRWVVLSQSQAFFDEAKVRQNSRDLITRPGFQLWTDDYSNLFEVIR